MAVSFAALRLARRVVGGAANSFARRTISRVGSRRHRRGGGHLTASEMGKITFMSQVLGKRNPAVTLLVMKAIGGRL